MEMYSTDYAGHYPRELGTLTPDYLKRIPECPAAGSVTYELETGPSAPGNLEKFPDFYTVRCKGHNHEEVNVDGDYPRYDALSGLIDRP